MKHGARNQLKGKVVGIKTGNVMAQVDVEVAGKNRMSSVLTVDSLNEMKLKKGDEVTVIVKAVTVLLAK
jgi:molybdopterin-binding protein